MKAMIRAGRTVQAPSKAEEAGTSVSAEDEEQEPPQGFIVADLFKDAEMAEEFFHPDRTECESVIDAAKAEDTDY